MKKVLSIITVLFISINIMIAQHSSSDNNSSKSSEVSKVKVLNFATFHMGNSSDANTVEFDEKDKKNQDDAKSIAQMISKFKPTIICVEVPADEQEELNIEYQKYLENPEVPSVYYGEVGLVAFEVARESGITQLHGIDYEMAYNYNIAGQIENAIDPNTITDFYGNLLKHYPELNVNEEELTLLERLRLGNTPNFLDFLILTNADLLTHVGSKDGYEGADEAAKFYKRNLRIYSNLNRIPVTKEDRIFILSGGSHTAFLGEFMNRSPKYEVVNTLEYLD